MDMDNGHTCRTDLLSSPSLLNEGYYFGSMSVLEVIDGALWLNLVSENFVHYKVIFKNHKRQSIFISKHFIGYKLWLLYEEDDLVVVSIFKIIFSNTIYSTISLLHSSEVFDSWVLWNACYGMVIFQNGRCFHTLIL